MTDDIFQSAMRSSGDVAGVFEYDGDVAYFYLYDLSKNKGQQIKSAIHVMSGVPDFSDREVRISWNKSEDFVGLYIKRKLWAAFDIDGTKYGGGYSPTETPVLPDELLSRF